MRLDLAGLVHLEQLLDVLLIGFRIARHGRAPEDADNVAGLQERQVQRHFRDAGREADDKETAIPVHRAQGRFGIVPADAVIDDVHATAAKLLDLVGERLLVGLFQRSARIDEALGRALLLGEIHLLLAGGSGNHFHAHRLAKLDSSEADTTGRTEDEQALASLAVTAILQGIIGRAVGHQQGRGLLEGHGVRESAHAGLVDNGFLGHAAPANGPHNTVPDLELGHFRADRLHDAGDFPAGGEGTLGLELVHVLDDEHVRIVHADGLDVDDDIALARLRARNVFKDQGLRATGRLREQGFHVRFPLTLNAV